MVGLTAFEPPYVLTIAAASLDLVERPQATGRAKGGPPHPRPLSRGERGERDSLRFWLCHPFDEYFGLPAKQVERQTAVPGRHRARSVGSYWLNLVICDERFF